MTLQQPLKIIITNIIAIVILFLTQKNQNIVMKIQEKL